MKRKRLTLWAASILKLVRQARDPHAYAWDPDAMPPGPDKVLTHTAMHV